MSFEECKSKIFSDLKRYSPDENNLVKCYLMNLGFRYSFWFRIAKYSAYKKGILLFLVHVISRALLIIYFFRYGTSISLRASIGPGICLRHLKGVIVAPETTIGMNCTLNKRVMVCKACHSKHSGSPTIKNNVYIDENALIIGDIEVGNNAIIGCYSVVKKNISDNVMAMPLPVFLDLR